ncbi:MAG TPA: prefoldin subunit alpha [Thermoplasmata archaeon]|nr:prefoldin subunit alpha [Thermoplasmata archaeon]
MSADSTEVTEQQVQEDLMRLDAYRSQLNALLQQYQILTNSRAEHARARESLEGVDRADPGAELLLPLGGEAFVRGSVDREAPVLIGMGSGVVVEMNRGKVTELLAQRLGRIEQAIRDVEGQMSTLDERIQILSRRLDELSRAGSGADVGRT